MFGFNKPKIEEDPCISQIVQFVRAVNGIKERDASSAWIDFYSPPLDVEIVCRYFEFGDFTPAALVYDYSHNTYPNGDYLLNAFTEQFNDKINISNFPAGTQLEIKNKDGSFEITFPVVPVYKGLVKKYRRVIADAIRYADLVFMDRDDKGNINPSRIYIEHLRRG